MAAKHKIVITERRGVSPEKAVKLLREFGTELSLEEAKLVLDVMYKIAKLSVEHYVRL